MTVLLQLGKQVHGKQKQECIHVISYWKDSAGKKQKALPPIAANALFAQTNLPSGKHAWINV